MTMEKQRSTFERFLSSLNEAEVQEFNYAYRALLISELAIARSKNDTHAIKKLIQSIDKSGCFSRYRRIKQ